MPDDRDPALDPAPEREDRLFPPDAAGGGSDDRRDPTDGRRDPAGGGGRDDGSDDGPDDDRLFPSVAGGASDDDPGGDATGGGRPGDDDGDPPSDGGAASTSPSVWAAASRPAAGGRAKGSNSFLRELPVLLLIAFVLAFVLRTFVVQVFYIPSGSMEPTLQVDDRMVVEKLTYRFREPARGEVAVFEGESFGQLDPEATTGERLVRGVGQFLGLVPASARDYVKRVVGLPGDEIHIVGGVVSVNGETLDEPYVVFEDPTDFGPVTVPDGQLFFLGDNRPNSSDSRRSLGYVDLDAVVGRAAYIIWPPDHAGSLMGTEYGVPADGA